jgi:hypothetical protein
MPPFALALEANIATPLTSTRKSDVPFFKRAPSPIDPNNNAKIWRVLGPVIGSVVVLIFAICAFLYARRLRKKRKRLTVATKYLERREVLTADLRGEPPQSPVHSDSTAGHNIDDHQWIMLTPPPVTTTSASPRPLSLSAQIHAVTTPTRVAFTPEASRPPSLPPPLLSQAIVHERRIRDSMSGIVADWRMSEIPTGAIYELKPSRASTDIMYERKTPRASMDVSSDRRPSRPSVEIVLEYRPPKAVLEAKVLSSTEGAAPTRRTRSISFVG